MHGKPILEIRYNRFIYLLLAPIALALSGLFFYLIFLSDSQPELQADTTLKLVFSFFILIGLFLAYQLIRAFLKNEPIFKLYEDGFEAKSNYQLSTGFIRWKDIRKVEEQRIRDGRGYSAALAVYLKQPGHRAQQASGTSEEEPVYILIGPLGERYAQVKKLIDEKVAPSAI